jgi:sugar lactone lactonase YvrE
MRELLTRGLGVLGALIGASLLVVAPVLAVEGDTVADAVLGQTSLTTNECNAGGISAASLCGPTAVAMDPRTSHLFVADTGNNRVLRFSNVRRFASSQAADLVLGQPDFTMGEPCAFPRPPAAAPTDRTFCKPSGLAIDHGGRLYVADSFYGRVLRFDSPETNMQAADLVLGRPDFQSVPARGFETTCAPEEITCLPADVTVDAANRVYVADEEKGVMRFDDPTSNGQAPDLVLTRPAGLFTGRCGSFQCETRAVAVAADGTIYEADMFLSRVWIIQPPFATNNAPAAQLGRSNGSELGFATPCNVGGRSGATLCQPAGLTLTSSEDLYVADTGNNRILRFQHPITNQQAADFVLGQPDLITNAGCNVGGVSANSLCGPSDVMLDFRGDLFVADTGNNRVLRFDQPSNGTQPPTGTRSVGVP